MSTTSPSFSSRQAALIAGLGYLAIFIVATFANSFALEKVIVQGDAAATAQNIMDAELLFRLGIAGWMVVMVADAVVAWALYLFFKPVNDGLALLAAILRVLFVAVFATGLFNLFGVLALVSGTGDLAAIELGQLHAQITPLLAAYDSAVHISFVMFGLHILVVGYLVFTTSNMPRILGVFLMVAAVGYQIDSFGNFVSSACRASSRRGALPLYTLFSAALRR